MMSFFRGHEYQSSAACVKKACNTDASFMNTTHLRYLDSTKNNLTSCLCQSQIHAADPEIQKRSYRNEIYLSHKSKL